MARRTSSVDLSEAALETALDEIKRFQEETGQSIALKPTKLLWFGKLTKKDRSNIKKLIDRTYRG